MLWDAKTQRTCCWILLAGSVKACFGHTEGAAGIHGAMLAILAVQQQAAPAIMHLRALNAYVSSAVAEWTSSCSLSAVAPKVTHKMLGLPSPGALCSSNLLPTLCLFTCQTPSDVHNLSHLPGQISNVIEQVLSLPSQEEAALPLELRQSLCAGASSFGMSGVNAHALLASTQGAGTQCTSEVALAA